MPKTKALNADVDENVFRRLKVYAAATGQTIKSVVNRWLDEKLQESEATS